MSDSEFDATKKKAGRIKLDTRTLLYLLLIGNLAVFLMPTVLGEILLMLMISLLALFCGVYGVSVKMGGVYLVLLALDYLMTLYLGDTVFIYIALGLRFIRKVFPCAMLGAILVMTIRVGKFMASLTKMRVSKSIFIPLTVLLRYLPSIKEDRCAIKKAMAMRNLKNIFFRHPAKAIECLYVPLMMSASRRADELSSAAVTRGIENPKPRTSIIEVRFHCADLVCATVATVFAAFCVWGI